MLNQEQLKELLDYNADTGIFRWKIDRAGPVKKGNIAGCIDKSNGYIKIGINYKRYRVHRLAWLYIYGEFPKLEIDHINHKRNDNRIKNLRDVSHSVNGLNSPIQKDNTSGYTGVYWIEEDKIWQARINSNNKLIYLGSSKFKNIAVLLRKRAELKYI